MIKLMIILYLNQKSCTNTTPFYKILHEHAYETIFPCFNFLWDIYLTRRMWNYNAYVNK